MKYTFINEMIRESIISYRLNEIPVGCIITKGDRIVCKTHNSKFKNNIAVNHAEINAIKEACVTLNSTYLNECSIYISLEPCIMCSGAIIESRISNIFIGTCNPYKGFFSTNYHKDFTNLNIKWLNNKKCETIINSFFHKKRKEL